ncbi:MAG: hypothetical protein Q8Q05_01340 [bacterium]|nr:hypothetical protein [bacterium]
MLISIDSSTEKGCVSSLGNNLLIKFRNEGYGAEVLVDPYGTEVVRQGLPCAIEALRHKSMVDPTTKYLLLLAARNSMFDYIKMVEPRMFVVLLGGPWKWLQDRQDFFRACQTDRSRFDSALGGLEDVLARKCWPDLCIHIGRESHGEANRAFPAVCSPSPFHLCDPSDIEDEMVRIFRLATAVKAPVG